MKTVKGNSPKTRKEMKEMRYFVERIRKENKMAHILRKEDIFICECVNLETGEIYKEAEYYSLTYAYAWLVGVLQTWAGAVNYTDETT